MYTLATLALCLSLVTPGAREPEIKWVANLAGRIYCSVVIADLNSDGLLEVLDCDSEDRQLVCVDSAGKELWRYGGAQVFSIRLTSAPAVGDLDGDGKQEIYLAGGDGRLIRLDGSGHEVWRLPLPGNVDWSSPSLLTAPEPLIVTGTNNGWLVAATPDGRLAWERHLRGGVGGPLGLADLDADGSQEVLCPGGDGGNYCYDYRGGLRWRVATMGPVDAGPVAAHLRQGEPLTLVCVDGEGAVAARDAVTRRLRWRYRTVAHNSSIDATLALADLDGDGGLETLFCDTVGYLYALRADGSEHWVARMDNGSYSAPAIGDVDGDQRVEVLVGGNDGFLYCFSAGGELKWRFNAMPVIGTSPAIADIDGDGEAEILFGSHNGRLHCLTLHGRYDPGLVPWPTRRFDPAQTGWLR